ncbi:MAG: hypothetical protein R2792_15680 [Saprospiraceae bacterium]
MGVRKMNSRVLDHPQPGSFFVAGCRFSLNTKSQTGSEFCSGAFYLCVESNAANMIRVHELLFEPLISQDESDTRILELGQTLTTAYADKTPLSICVLNGSFVFAADLLRKFDGPCEITFVKLASYEGTTSPGRLKGTWTG